VTSAEEADTALAGAATLANSGNSGNDSTDKDGNDGGKQQSTKSSSGNGSSVIGHGISGIDIPVKMVRLPKCKIAGVSDNGAPCLRSQGHSN